jgi:hypothetical protein
MSSSQKAIAFRQVPRSRASFLLVTIALRGSGTGTRRTILDLGHDHADRRRMIRGGA